jgi:ABC-2 type transport system ATP-binding protein
MLAIETHALTRSYPSGNGRADILALDGVTMSMDQGEVRGLLGPNGAGKTTLIKILSTVLLPTAGWARVLGHDVANDTRAVRPLIGIVFGGDKGLYMRLTARQNLEYWAALYQVPPKKTRARVDHLLARTGLAERADHLVQTFSRGMKQRLHLARGMVGDARVLYLDEPTLGMDPMAARDFRQIVHDLREEGRTILITTHDMAEAEALCDRVALIDHGKVLAVETPSRLSEYVAKFERIDFDGGDPDLIEHLGRQDGVAAVKKASQGSGHRIELSSERAQQSVLTLLVERGITSIRTSRPSLEEVYVHLIGNRGLRV